MCTLLLAMVCLAPMVGFCCNAEPVRPKIGHYPKSVGELLNLRKVVLVELACEGAYPEVAHGMTQALFRAIQDKKLFHTKLIRRTDPICRDLPLDKQRGFTIRELAAIHDALKCDAVLLGSVHAFHPHPRMQMGVYLLMLDLKDGKAVWVVDYTWDTTDDQTVRRIKKFFRTQMREGYDPINWELVLRSPRLFEKFIAYEIADTLPAVEPVPPPRRKWTPLAFFQGLRKKR